ncbi:MurT ligase domain-containing protein [Lapillicoccus sp.]|uniref:MurT ligase domain-containing protein n=1 Tax=Lapillicoccus sp. TaxID=1909287 RepID=UPI00326741CD
MAVIAGKTARLATRFRGGGSAAPGLVVERIDPQFLAYSLAGLRDGVVVVTGTNGKTTTTKMLAAILRAHGKRVFSNPTGSNFTRGVISAMLGDLPLSGRLDADVAVVELDEWHALQFAKVVRPTHALLLNVARDQLDRFAEIDTTARLLASLATQATTGVVLNRDDSFVARIRGQLDADVEVAWFGVDPEVVDDLPPLHEADVRFLDQMEVPPAGERDGLLHPIDAVSFRVDLGSQRVGPLELRQRGLAAMINATAATTAARQVLGDAFSCDDAARALREVTPPFGRGEVINADGHPLELVLVKNPAGFTVALGTYGGEPVTTMIAINDDYADGQDVSWLYDVNFESLRHKGVALTAGARAYDMALRLDYDDVVVDAVEPDLERALGRLLRDYSQEPRRIFCTYTAMMRLRRMLAARYGLANFGEEQG